MTGRGLLIHAAFVTALVSALAGCGGSTPMMTHEPRGGFSRADDDNGALTGTLRIYGGAQTAHTCGCFKAGGRIRITSKSGNTLYILAGDGYFGATIPVGSYRVTAAATYVVVKGGKHSPVSWPMGSCEMFSSSAGPPVNSQTYIHVRPGKTTQIEVGCFGE
jgi:hypothetical protein